MKNSITKKVTSQSVSIFLYFAEPVSFHQVRDLWPICCISAPVCSLCWCYFCSLLSVLSLMIAKAELPFQLWQLIFCPMSLLEPSRVLIGNSKVRRSLILWDTNFRLKEAQSSSFIHNIAEKHSQCLGTFKL